MSSSTPGPRRRRIAGERKTAARPTHPAEESASTVDEPVADPAPVQEREPAAPRPAADRAASPSDGKGKTGGAGTQRRPAPPALMAGAVAAALGLILIAGVLALVVDGAGWGDWKRVQEHDQVADAIRTAPGAAEQAAATILSYDHESLEADRDAAAALMTQEYREEYVQTFDELVLEPARERQAQVEADVRASGVAAAGPDRVEVLLFVNQTTVSTANSGEPQTALNRVVLAMEKVDGAWRVDEITSY